MATTIAERDMVMRLLSGFAVAAVLLAMLGMYAALSFEVGDLRRELGIRSALGATRFYLLAMVVRRGLAVTLAGVVTGVVVTVWTTDVLRRYLNGVSAADPHTHPRHRRRVGARRSSSELRSRTAPGADHPRDRHEVNAWT